MTETLLDIRDLRISLPAGADRAYAVDGVTLALRRDEIMCIVGESGSGKSLLANAVMGLLPGAVRIAGGSIHFDGTDLARLDPEAYRDLRGRRIAMIFQEPMTALNPIMTVGEQIDELLVAHGMTDKAARKRRVVELLAATELPEPELLYHAYPFRLSGGQRQRVMIACALALEPDILIADEPTTALDVTTQKQILTLIRDLQARRRIAVLFITHDFGVVAEIAHRVAVMQWGKVVEEGTADAVLRQPQHPYTQRLVAAVHGLSARPALAEHAAEPLLEVVGLTKTFRTTQGLFVRRKREVHALRQVSLTIHRGETVGLVGESGSGKTTLGHAIVRLVQTDAGEVRFRGTDILAQSGSALRATRARIQMVFQDPFASLNPRHSVGRILTETPRIHGVPKAEAEARARRLLELVGLDASAFGRYPHEFSGGQRQRIGIARALALEPELIVADEPVSALDVSVQGQVLDLLADIRRRLGLAMLFITHDLRVAAQVCDTIAVMRRGELVEIGPAAEVFRRPQHEYTQRLLASVPGGEWADGPSIRETVGQA